MSQYDHDNSPQEPPEQPIDDYRVYDEPCYECERCCIPHNGEPYCEINGELIDSLDECPAEEE